MGEEGATLPNWSTKLEDLIDDEDYEGAKVLLEGIVSDLEKKADADTNLTLASALTDLSSVYRRQGLSIKADSCSTSAFLIRKRTEQQTPPSRVGVSPLVQPEHNGEVEELSTAYSNSIHEQEPSHSGSKCEEEWETALSEGLLKLNGLSASTKSPAKVSNEKSTYKQRGRGAFTYGSMGLHCDRLSEDITSEHDKEAGETDDATPDVNPKGFGVRHVLVVTFPPSVVTKDLEALLEPYAVNGVSIRWVNDTTALAVFRNPEVAKEALRAVKKPQFKVQQLTEDNELLAVIDERDLQPPVPRPATSSQAAHRMIMGALRSQGINNKSVSKTAFQDTRKQESERKQRILTRQKLRDEAWGDD